MDPVIAHQQTQRHQNVQDQTIHALSKAVRELQQQLHLVRADSAIPEGNDLTTTESQIISVENIPLPGTVSNFPLRSNRENTTQVTQSNQGEGNIGTVNSKPNSRTESPILEAQKVDFDALEREINRRQSTSSEGSSSSSSSGSSSSSSSSTSCDQDVLNLATDPLEINSDSDQNSQITRAKNVAPR